MSDSIFTVSTSTWIDLVAVILKVAPWGRKICEGSRHSTKFVPSDPDIAATVGKLGPESRALIVAYNRAIMYCGLIADDDYD